MSVVETISVFVIHRQSLALMQADAFKEMEEILTAARVAAAEAEFKAGRYTRGSADDLMAELAEP